MARSFFIKSKKVLLSVSLLTSLLFGVFALPLYTVKADDSYQIGLPDLEVWDEKLVNTNYPNNIHSYFDMVWYGLYLQIYNYCSNNDIESPTFTQISQFFTSLSPSLATVLSQGCYDPSVYVNIYGNFLLGSFNLLIEVAPVSTLLDQPSYYTITNGNIALTTGNLPICFPLGSTGFSFLGFKYNNNNPELLPSYPSAGITSFNHSNEHYFVMVYGISYSDLSISSLGKFSVSDYRYPAYSPSNSTPQNFHCLVHSFPYYNTPYIYTQSYNQPYFGGLYAGFANHAFRFRQSSVLDDGIYYFELDDYIVYSEYQFLFYPTPTPYPTALPTITPTPLPLGYDTDVSGTNDALGYLSTLGDYFTNILSTWTVIPLLATTLGYVFHYSPWFGIALLVPTIALLSLLIGRNKS